MKLASKLVLFLGKQFFEAFIYNNAKPNCTKTIKFLLLFLIRQYTEKLIIIIIIIEV